MSHHLGYAMRDVLLFGIRYGGYSMWDMPRGISHNVGQAKGDGGEMVDEMVDEMGG
jgi:hypothetical protein